MKNPFAGDDNSTCILFLLGMIVLVFVGLGLSLLVDSSIKLPDFNASSAKLRAENDTLCRKMDDLEMKLVVQERQDTQAEKNREAVTLREDLEKQLASANQEIPILQRLIKEAEESIQLITKGRETYRLQYRDHVRAVAVGETYDNITSTRGKTYKSVSIHEVSPLGISIAHEAGAMRLGFSEMPAEWRKKFMFTANEVAEATLVEQKRLQKIGREMARREKEIRKVNATKSRSAEISRLRSQIATLTVKETSAKLEASLAQSKVASQNALAQSRAFSQSSYRRYNSSSGTFSTYRPRYRITSNAKQSVPGSLETWDQRAVRYQRTATRYGAQLVNLRSRLESLDPSYNTISPVQN